MTAGHKEWSAPKISYLTGPPGTDVIAMFRNFVCPKCSLKFDFLMGWVIGQDPEDKTCECGQPFTVQETLDHTKLEVVWE